MSPAIAAPNANPTAVNTAHQRRYRWIHGGRDVEIALTDSGGPGPAWLMLPALSTISSRMEWKPFCDALLENGQRNDSQPPRLIRVDWPGFGESERPHLPYNPALLASFLADFQRDCCPADCGLIAAGHAAGIALLAAQRHGLEFREWVLVAPTWRGPFPTMAQRRSRAFPLIRALVEAPLLGPVLYRFNTSRSVLGWMSRRHVDVAGPGLTPEGIATRQCIARQRGARFASAAFVTGGLDPYDDPDGWLAAAKGLQPPLTVVIADQSPPKSLAEMQALAAVADRVLHLPGRLGAHEEFGRALAGMLG
ncbi:alpha/beta fold hydrolase [Synechococcus sp. BA-132 BA5]|uniref:alpha/beta fold hydrolase n=1 Tax=Synechococcus sp. BA-132 BA5 TaxID=3110252 RepID=UPI002B21143D|nr:alpha/beta hydrolase [Synechococcus sp. BA-132 BA5]MEA5416897.1 alpha/beta hydrolase [Synechococcus sp. BA-132 BA5]